MQVRKHLTKRGERRELHVEATPFSNAIECDIFFITELIVVDNFISSHPNSHPASLYILCNCIQLKIKS